MKTFTYLHVVSYVADILCLILTTEIDPVSFKLSTLAEVVIF